MMRTKLAVAFFVVLSAFVPSLFAESGDAFSLTNGQYSAGHFREAINGYETLVRAGRWNANLFYNLANAYFRDGDSGRAILNYERALALEPNHPEARTNLRLVRDQTRALELRRDWRDRVAAFASPTQIAVMAAIAFWTTLSLLAFLWRAPRRSSALVFLAILGFAACVISMIAVYAVETGAGGKAVAVVTAKDIQARLATADNAATVLPLPPGSEIKIVSTRGNWVYAILPNELAGWIPAGSAEMVRL